MKDPNDTRDIAPRYGSPLWIHMTAVSVVGAAVIAVALVRLHGLHYLARNPQLWLLALMIVIGDIWPIITPGRSGSEAPAASTTFSFATLLAWGMPSAVLLRAAATIVVGALQRKAPHRVIFNTAQMTISLAGAGLVLLLFGISPLPRHTWVPDGRSLPVVLVAGAVYFAINYCLVAVAVGLHSRLPLLRVLQANVRYQGFVTMVTLSAAPLVAVVMSTRSSWMVALFAMPLAGIYVNAAISVQREHQAHHDELTGLSNRKLLFKRGAVALESAQASGGRVGFLLLDLGRFKGVNDTLGHAVGDQVLQFVAHRLTHSVRPGDLVARLGGDEFAVLLPSARDASVAREVASRLRAALSEPIAVEGVALEIEASVGIALYPDDAETVEMLMRRADVAMYLAKKRRSGVERYTADADRNSPDKRALLADLRRGLDRDELELYFQPKIRLADAVPIGMEALLRWRHPRLGLLAPGAFLDLAEQSYLMREITARVVSAALAQAQRWHGAGYGLQVSLNVAARDLLGGALADQLDRELCQHGLPAHALAIEIEEKVLATEPAHAVAGAAKLAAIGVGLTLDKFSTGYTSLVRLKQLGVREIKIDRSLTSALPGSKDNAVTVKSIAELAKALGIRSVAVGVASADTEQALRRLGCDGAQGFSISEPLSADDATAWLVDRLRPAETVPEGGAPWMPAEEVRRPGALDRAGGHAPALRLSATGT